MGQIRRPYMVALAIVVVVSMIGLITLTWLLSEAGAQSPVTGIAHRTEFLVDDIGDTARRLSQALDAADERFFRARLRADVRELASNVRCLRGVACTFQAPANWPVPAARKLLEGGVLPGVVRLERYRQRALALAGTRQLDWRNPDLQHVTNHEDELVALVDSVMRIDREEARKSHRQIPLLVVISALALVALLTGYYVVAVAPLVRRISRRTRELEASLEENRRTQADLERAQASLVRAHEIANFATWEYDVERREFRWSDELYAICGHEREAQLPATGFVQYCHPDDYEAMQSAVADARRQRTTYAVEHRIVRRDGHIRWVNEQGEFLFEGERAVRAIGAVLDVTDRKMVEQRVAYLAQHDTLTGLPNRRLLVERLETALAEARENHRDVAVLFIDFDRFKRVNDTLGHHVGDEVLVAAARRLQQQVRGTDTLARVGGDEFVVVLDSIEGHEAAARVAKAIVEAFASPISCNGRQFSMTVSVGVSDSATDGTDCGELLRAADAAMYAVKRQGRDGYLFHTPKMDDESRRRLSIENELREGIERDELVLFYQPIVDAHGRTESFEALVRWNHPQRGLLAPDAFIGVAEESGLIVPLGDCVLRKAATAAVHWARGGLLRGRVAVNISGAQFDHEGFVQSVDRVLEETGCDGKLLDFEVTESVIMHDPAGAALRCQRLRERGIQLSIDDFGTGYSSLATLKRLPFDTLKIDRSFIADLDDDAHSAAIPRSIVALAHSLGLRVVAEGVETEQHARILRGLKCDAMQGFLFSRPVPFEQAAASLEQALRGAEPAVRTADQSAGTLASANAVA